jgi:superfamily II DNA/RNA helicase
MNTENTNNLTINSDNESDTNESSNPSEFVIGDYTCSEEIINYDTFESLGLSENTLKGIYAYGYETPSRIQQKAIKPMLQNRDMIAQSHSGTGKTGTFVIGTLELIDKSINAPQTIIISPTRELAKQTEQVCKNLSKFHKTISVHLAIGGIQKSTNSRRFAHMDKSSNEINNKIIVGTPGRICDMITRKLINMTHIKNLILDEGDEILSIGFYDQIQKIVRSIPESGKIHLFSATIPDEMVEFIEKCNILKNPLKILVKQEQLSLAGIQQYYIILEEHNKYAALKEIYELIDINQSIIYCNSRKKVEILTNMMQDDNFPVKCVTGDMTQADRNEIVGEFKAGSVRVLITTDLLSRGIDIQQVSLVINYDLPKDTAVYIHRIGRSGRYGRKACSINFADYNRSDDKNMMKDIEDTYNITLQELPQDVQSIFNGY